MVRWGGIRLTVLAQASHNDDNGTFKHQRVWMLGDAVYKGNDAQCSVARRNGCGWLICTRSKTILVVTQATSTEAPALPILAGLGRCHHG